MDAPFQLADPRLQGRLLACVDLEDKIPRAIQTLGRVADRRVLLLDAQADGFRDQQLRVMGARVTAPEPGAEAGAGTPGEPFDAAVAWWTLSSSEAPDPVAALRANERFLGPGGRLLAVEDYGRDDVAALWADADREARLVGWSRRDGPLLGAGFRVRVLHCWWTFRDAVHAAELLTAAFPATGTAVVAAMRRPRLSYRVAIYHLSTEPREAAA